MRKLLGSYVFGWDNVRVYITDGACGSFTLVPQDKGSVAINIGIDHDRYQDVLEVVLHEAQEFIFTRTGHRFIDSQTQTREHTQYMFCFNHTQFSEMQARVAEFLSVVLPDIYKEWKNRKSKR